MGHLYHGNVSHNQRVDSAITLGPWIPQLLVPLGAAPKKSLASRGDGEDRTVLRGWVNFPRCFCCCKVMAADFHKMSLVYDISMRVMRHLISFNYMTLPHDSDMAHDTMILTMILTMIPIADWYLYDRYMIHDTYHYSWSQYDNDVW